MFAEAALYPGAAAAGGPIELLCQILTCFSVIYLHSLVVSTSITIDKYYLVTFASNVQVTALLEQLYQPSVLRLPFSNLVLPVWEKRLRTPEKRRAVCKNAHGASGSRSGEEHNRREKNLLPRPVDCTRCVSRRDRRWLVRVKSSTLSLFT